MLAVQPLPVRLPGDMWLTIFKNVDDPHDKLFIVPRVCVSWNSISKKLRKEKRRYFLELAKNYCWRKLKIPKELKILRINFWEKTGLTLLSQIKLDKSPYEITMEKFVEDSQRVRRLMSYPPSASYSGSCLGPKFNVNWTPASEQYNFSISADGRWKDLQSLFSLYVKISCKVIDNEWLEKKVWIETQGNNKVEYGGFFAWEELLVLPDCSLGFQGDSTHQIPIPPKQTFKDLRPDIVDVINANLRFYTHRAAGLNMKVIRKYDLTDLALKKNRMTFICDSRGVITESPSKDGVELFNFDLISVGERDRKSITWHSNDFRPEDLKIKASIDQLLRWQVFSETTDLIKRKLILEMNTIGMDHDLHTHRIRERMIIDDPDIIVG